MRPLHSPAAAATGTIAAPTASSSTAPDSSSSSSASLPAVSAQLSSSHPLTFLAFVPMASKSPSAAPSVEPDVLECLASQLTALLSVPSDPVFVAHCLHNSALQLLLSSYLHHASQQSSTPPPEHAAIAESVYLVFQRLTTAAPAATLAAAHFVTLPLLLQLASLYYAAMPDATTAIVDRLVTALPSLAPQLSAFCAALSQSLAGLQSSLALPAPVSFIASSVSFLSASFGSLHALFACTSSWPSTAPFASHPSFLPSSVRLYDRLCELGRDNRGDVAESISESRRVMLSALHAVVNRALIQPLQRESGDVRRLSDTVFQLVADWKQHSPLFLAHYAHVYRLSADIKKITALPTVIAALGAPRVSQLVSFLPPPPSAIPLLTASLFRSRSSEAKEEQSIGELCAMFDNAISADFARACLREYNGDLDVAVQHIFDNMLPARLQNVARDDRRHWTEDGDSRGEPVHQRQGDILADEDDGGSAFQAYLLRTGRVLKSEAEKAPAGLSRSSLSLFEPDDSVKEMLKERIIASQALDAMYADEYDDSYSGFLSFSVDETALDVNDRTDGRQREQQGSRALRAVGDRERDGEGGPGRAAGRAAEGGAGEDVRARWRREEAERESRREEQAIKRIELIPPSRRTEEEKRDWERLTQQQPQHAATAHSAAAPTAVRGMREMRARGGAPLRGGAGRGGASAVAADDSRDSGRGIGSGTAQLLDGSLGTPREPAYRGRGGRGRDSRSAAPRLSSEEVEAARNKRIQQAAKDKEERKRRLNSDEDEPEEGSGNGGGEEDEGEEEDEMDLSAQSVMRQGPDDSGSGGPSGGDGRGRGNVRHTYGSGPRNNAGRGGRGRGHNARGAHKAMAMKKMNSGMAR